MDSPQQLEVGGGAGYCQETRGTLGVTGVFTLNGDGFTGTCICHHRLKIILEICVVWGFPGGTSGKEPTCQCRKYKRLGFDPGVGKIPRKRA